jgi:hypothetical protein
MVRDLAVRRLKAELMMEDPELQPGGEFYGRDADYGVLKFAFYKCFRCRVSFLF